MARTFKLISGTDEVDLIDTRDPGIIATRGGFGKNRNAKKNTFTSSELSDGARLRFQKTMPVAERYKLNVQGSSQNNAALLIQRLQRILRKGDLNQLTDWQEEPLYIKQQTTNELRPRYAKVLAWSGNVFSDLFAPPFEGDSDIDNLELTLVREPFWSSEQPGVVPPMQPLMTPDYPGLDFDQSFGFDSGAPAWAKTASFEGSTTVADHFDSVTDAGGILSISDSDAMEGIQSLEIDATGGLGYGVLNLDAINQASAIISFWFDPQTAVAGGNTDVIVLKDGAGNAIFWARLRAVNDLQFRYKSDGTASNNLGVSSQLTEARHFVMYFRAALNPGTNDGIVRVFQDGELILSTTDIDSDTLDVDLAWIGKGTATAGTGIYRIDSVWLDTVGAPFISSIGANIGNFGAVFPIMDNTLRTLTTTAPSNEKKTNVRLSINPNSLSMAVNDEFVIAQANGSGPTGTAWRLHLGMRAEGFYLQYDYDLNDSSTISLNKVTIADDWVFVEIEWKASDGVINNGEISVLIGDTLQTASDIVNSDHDVDEIVLGPSGLDTGTSGLLYIDYLLWSDDIPVVRWNQQLVFESTLGFVSNFRQSTGVLTHILAFDASATGFSGNLAFEPSWAWFEVSGSTPAVGDIMYFGSDEPFFHLIFDTAVALNAADLTFDVEYWNGSWTDLPTGTAIVNPGDRVLKWPGKSDWATVAINGETKYWIRIIIDGLTSWTTSPEQGNQIVYAVNNPYIELNNTQVHGDVPPISMFRLLNYITPTNADVAWVGMGIKSRGLTNFISRLNAGGDNPTTWITAYGTDTSQVADETAPGGNKATCTFSSNQTLIQRLSISVSDADIETDMEGTYRVYLRAKQVGGSAGDVTMQIRIKRSSTQIGEQVKTLQADADIDLYDMGVFGVSREDVLGDERTLPLNLQFLVFASSSNGTTPNLEIHDIVLLPIDEQALFLSWPGQDPLSAKAGLQIDSGILRESSNRFIFSETIGNEGIALTSPWETRGAFLEIEPRRKSRIYFLIAGENSNIIDRSNQGQGMGVTLNLVERWNTIRGRD